MLMPSLHDFLVSSSLGTLSLLLEESEVVRQLGLPDETMEFHLDPPEHTNQTLAIYGSLSLEYDQSRRVMALSVHIDNDHFPQITPKLRIDPWGIVPGMSSQELIARLRQESIEFITTVTNTGIPVFQILNRPHAVHVIFQGESSDDHIISYLSTASKTDSEDGKRQGLRTAL